MDFFSVVFFLEWVKQAVQVHGIEQKEKKTEWRINKICENFLSFKSVVFLICIKKQILVRLRGSQALSVTQLGLGPTPASTKKKKN